MCSQWGLQSGGASWSGVGGEGACPHSRKKSDVFEGGLGYEQVDDLHPCPFYQNKAPIFRLVTAFQQSASQFITTFFLYFPEHHSCTGCLGQYRLSLTGIKCIQEQQTFSTSFSPSAHMFVDLVTIHVIFNFY